MSEMLHRTPDEAIKMEMHPAADLWNIQVDRNQPENVLLNLAISARDATCGGGMSTVAADNVAFDNTQADVCDQLIPGNYFVFSVTDVDMDTPSEAVEYASEPFFTTKPNGRGMDPGPNIAFGFIK